MVLAAVLATTALLVLTGVVLARRRRQHHRHIADLRRRSTAVLATVRRDLQARRGELDRLQRDAPLRVLGDLTGRARQLRDDVAAWTVASQKAHDQPTPAAWAEVEQAAQQVRRRATRFIEELDGHQRDLFAAANHLDHLAARVDVLHQRVDDLRERGATQLAALATDALRQAAQLLVDARQDTARPGAPQRLAAAVATAQDAVTELEHTVDDVVTRAPHLATTLGELEQLATDIAAACRSSADPHADWVADHLGQDAARLVSLRRAAEQAPACLGEDLDAAHRTVAAVGELRRDLLVLSVHADLLHAPGHAAAV